jgi:circadian clock protein KaiB
MNEPHPNDGGATARFELLASEPGEEQYVLRLYISGLTPRSTEALATIRAVCDEHLQGRFQLEVIDLYQYPERADTDEIIATPTLIKQLPAPLRRLVGDLSDVERVLVGLNLRKRHGP